MKLNVGKADRVIRVLLALVLGGLYFTQTVTGVLGIVLLVAAGILVVTSLFSFCPIYAIFGMNTCPAKQS